MLTRHLYEADEVSAALTWCIKKRKIVEACFWTQEFLDSEMTDELYQCLYSTWLFHFGIAKLSGLTTLYNLFHREEETSEEDILSFVCGLTRLPPTTRDSSVFSLILLGLSETGQKQYDRANKINSIEKEFADNNLTSIERHFLCACWQGKSRLAWELSRILWKVDPQKVWFLLDKFCKFRHPENSALVSCLHALQDSDIPDCLWANRACAICIVSAKPNSLKESLVPIILSILSEVEDERGDWKSLEGRRKRRIYSIPQECLYWITQRGKISNQKKNIKWLYCHSWDRLRGCAFWDRVLEEEQPWLSDENYEHFWEKYFPDDTPDEWSLSDQQKSHGHGALIYSEIPNFQKYIDKWISVTPCRSAWLGNYIAIKESNKIENPDCCWDTKYNETDFTYISDSWNLELVSSRVVVPLLHDENLPLHKDNSQIHNM